MVKKYGKAWTTGDTDLLCSLFEDSPDCVYVESAARFMRGRKEIANYWEAQIRGHETDVQTEYFPQRTMIDEARRTALVMWAGSFIKRDGRAKAFLQVAMLKFAKNGRIKSLEEYMQPFHKVSEAARYIGIPEVKVTLERIGREGSCLVSECPIDVGEICASWQTLLHYPKTWSKKLHRWGMPEEFVVEVV